MYKVEVKTDDVTNLCTQLVTKVHITLNQLVDVSKVLPSDGE